MKRALISLLLVLTPLSAWGDTCAMPEGGLLVMGYQPDAGWQIYKTTGGKSWSTIKTRLEPRMFASHSRTGQVAYIGIDGDVYLRAKSGRENRIIQAEPALAFTQPAFSPDGGKVYLTGLIKGNSQDTDLYVYDIQKGELSVLSKQRSAQFEPYVSGDWLYYSNVSCVTGCSGIIQDVWRRHVISGEAEQLTMTKGIAREPTFCKAGKTLYFSSNQAGNYHIWRLVEGDDPEPVTTGAVTDTSPKVLESGAAVYFLRQDSAGQEILCHDGAREHRIALPERVTKIRNLEL
ncbi:hypothetical protein Y5W_02113 [Alcanivorax sp. 521-1]|uniref:DUF5050 domain-containing protein n=1 Tax=Alloalcanivorax profundimaris TaxID=2735259 RepID=A0ABS0ARR2_9GAMM|nr:PD40 domain-containing protein [Alloalcanivorax profundimaris]MBF5056819.1 hypothetical protein [Alloalcanivorax profundimaris]